MVGNLNLPVRISTNLSYAGILKIYTLLNIENTPQQLPILEIIRIHLKNITDFNLKYITKFSAELGLPG